MKAVFVFVMSFMVALLPDVSLGVGQSNAAKPAVAKKKPKMPSARERLRAYVKNEVNDPLKKLGTAEAVRLLEDYRMTNQDCADHAVRVDVDYEILNRCQSRYTPRRAKFDALVAAQTIERVAPRIYEDPDVGLAMKFKAVDMHCTQLCDQSRFDEALAIARRYTAMKDARGNVASQAYTVLMNVYRLAGRYQEAMAAIKEGIAVVPQNGDLCVAAAGLALEFDDVKSVPGIWKLNVDRDATYKMLGWVLEHRDALGEAASFREETLEGVMPFVTDARNKPNQRLVLACRAGLIENTPEGSALRRAVRDVLEEGKASIDVGTVRRLKWRFMDGDWGGFADVYAELSSLKALRTPELRRAHVFALIALGRKDEAKKLVSIYCTEMANPVDVVKTEVLLAVAEGRDALAIVASANLESKEHARVVQLASQWALVLQRNDACRRYSEAYAKMIVPIPKRRQNVTWSARPLDGEAEWRALYPSLEKSFVDVKMCGDLDNLITDVATGRVAVEKTDKDTQGARIEVSTACDVKGVHVYLRVADQNARAVEDGFAGGKVTEMYFAPGDNRPYVCFGGSASEPLAYLFNTSYTWEGYQRLVKGDPESRCNMKAETFFTDDDYVLHYFFPWDAFYQNLPSAGSEWKLECIADGFSWGGSQGVHESSSWGRVVFNLKPEELTAIRRRILLKNVKTWNRGGNRSFATVATFDRWADPVIGDPAFYRDSLEPLEQKLAAYAKRVTPEMTDADVNDIYEHAVPLWIGLKHVIDRLRRNYLMDKEFGR